MWFRRFSKSEFARAYALHLINSEQYDYISRFYKLDEFVFCGIESVERFTKIVPDSTVTEKENDYFVVKVNSWPHNKDMSLKFANRNPLLWKYFANGDDEKELFTYNINNFKIGEPREFDDENDVKSEHDFIDEDVQSLIGSEHTESNDDDSNLAETTCETDNVEDQEPKAKRLRREAIDLQQGSSDMDNSIIKSKTVRKRKHYETEDEIELNIDSIVDKNHDTSVDQTKNYDEEINELLEPQKRLRREANNLQLGASDMKNSIIKSKTVRKRKHDATENEIELNIAAAVDKSQDSCVNQTENYDEEINELLQPQKRLRRESSNPQNEIIGMENTIIKSKTVLKRKHDESENEIELNISSTVDKSQDSCINQTENYNEEINELMQLQNRVRKRKLDESDDEIELKIASAVDKCQDACVDQNYVKYDDKFDKLLKPHKRLCLESIDLQEGNDESSLTLETSKQELKSSTLCLDNSEDESQQDSDETEQKKE